MRKTFQTVAPVTFLRRASKNQLEKQNNFVDMYVITAVSLSYVLIEAYFLVNMPSTVQIDQMCVGQICDGHMSIGRMCGFNEGCAV